MSPKATQPKQDTKMALLQAGTELMHERGYTATGVQDVLSKLGMPKGSFYHHFDSKETFAVEIIRHFDVEYTALLTRTLQNPAQTPIERLRAYLLETKERLAAQDCRKGCLIGNLSQEMADQSELLRNELCTVIQKWRKMLADCIREGQSNGEIVNKRSAEDLAEVLAAGCNGAVMRAKTLKCTEPMDTFIVVFFEDVLKS